MKKLHNHIITVICSMILSASIATAQTAAIKHTVERGETLATIAKRYATTEAKIIEMNPDAAQFVYVGMELTIPATAASATSAESAASVTSGITEAATSDVGNTYSHSAYVQQTPSTIHDTTGSSDYADEDFSRWSPIFQLSYGFLPKAKGENVSGTNFTFSASLGVNYNFTKSFFAGARLGYTAIENNTLIHNDIADYTNIKITNHVITLPIETGYRIHIIEEKLALTPYAGLDLNYIAKCSMEQGTGANKEKTSGKPDDRFGLNARIGGRINIFGFLVGASYVFSLDDNFGDNDGYPEISIGWEL